MDEVDLISQDTRKLLETLLAEMQYACQQVRTKLEFAEWTAKFKKQVTGLCVSSELEVTCQHFEEAYGLLFDESRQKLSYFKSHAKNSFQSSLRKSLTSNIFASQLESSENLS